MKRILPLFAALALLAAGSLVRADVITAKEAAQHIGEVQTVRGVVVSARYAARSRGRPTFLNLDQPYPDTIFTVVIWGSDRAKFSPPPEEAFDGKTVHVTGKITEYRGKPEIVVRSPDQITVDKAGRDRRQ